MIKTWIKGPKMTDVIAKVKDFKRMADKYEITVWWHNTGRAMGLPIFPMYTSRSQPVVETIKLNEDTLSTWRQSDSAEDLV